MEQRERETLHVAWGEDSRNQRVALAWQAPLGSQVALEHIDKPFSLGRTKFTKSQEKGDAIFRMRKAQEK